MTLPADLDTWADGIGTATGLSITRDPAKVYPPCLYVGLPDTVATTIASTTLELPVWLVGAGAAKQAGDQLLTSILTVLAALEQKDATAETLSLGDVEYHAYRITAVLHIT